MPFTYSAGWAEYAEGETGESLLSRADQKLYLDKQTGSAVQRARAAHEELREAEKMEIMGRFTNIVAHEFNNLLTTIKGYAELLLQQPDNGDSAPRALGHIQKSAERATNLTSQLLAFSRRQALEPRSLSLPAVLASMDALVQRLIGDEIQLTVHAEPGVHSIHADEGQIQQIFLHLLFRACSAIYGPGKVEVDIGDYAMDAAFLAEHPGSRPGRYVKMAVRDTGQGMDAATCRRLFEPLVHSPKVRPRFGLATVYGVLKQSGGYIWVDSDPNDGTCITVYLPWAEDLAAEASLPLALAPAADVSKAIKVLVVESFDGLRAFICDFLRAAGYTVLEAANGEHAMSSVADAERPVDLLICDVVLPGMSGLELAECLAAQNRELQVLYVAGYSEDAFLYREWLRDGSGHFLASPFSTEELRHELLLMEMERVARQGEQSQTVTSA
jgi:signal transduction histidine kinase/CheY-like chemotaxis protein